MDVLPEMNALIDRHAPATTQPSRVPGLYVFRSETTTVPLEAAYTPMLCVITAGAKQALLGDATFTYRAGDCLVVSAELPVTGRVIEAPYRAIGLDLDPTEIARMTLDAADIANRPPPRGLVVARMEDDLFDPVARLLRLLDRPEEIEFFAPLIKREILWRLLAGPHGPIMRQIGAAESRLAGINRVLRWIRVHYAEPMRLEVLAQMAGMSLSTFHRHFRTVTTMSPLQFQKSVRLQEARARLLSGGGAAEIGFQVGYDSPSQFSREYARVFGEPPARDVARLRQQAVAGG
jgi:AraC-like DNA-binding protein